MEIITKIREIHNKFIQKLDTPDNIDTIIDIFPLIVFFMPGIVGFFIAIACSVNPEETEIYNIITMFIWVGGSGYPAIHNVSNVEEKNKNYCFYFIIITTIICYGTFFTIFFYHLLFH